MSKILKYCYSNDTKCVVQSGNTSLVAGSVPIENEVIISMKKMNKIIELDPNSGVLECESGCILQDLELFANEQNRIIPYDLGAKGSCLIGGNLATNAGGLRFIKYGPLHGNVLGLEVVLPNGDIIDLMSKMRKDNTGYHLRHLFIGSEGTLGIITKVSILCPMKFRNRIATLLSLKSFDRLLQIYRIIQTEFNEYLSCFEMMDLSSIEAVVHNLDYPHPLQEPYPFYVMFEFSTNDQQYLENRLFDLFERLTKDSIILNGTFVTDAESQKYQKLKAYRELITEGLKKDGHAYKYDISLPLNVYYEVVEVMRKRLQHSNCTRVCGYGHIGDGNLHFNVTSKTYDQDILNQIEPFLYEYVSKHRGSISAEHGIGFKKKDYLSYSKSAEAIQLMKQIKQLFDSKQILNPNKIF